MNEKKKPKLSDDNVLLHDKNYEEETASIQESNTSQNQCTQTYIKRGEKKKYWNSRDEEEDETPKLKSNLVKWISKQETKKAEFSGSIKHTTWRGSDWRMEEEEVEAEGCFW